MGIEPTAPVWKTGILATIRILHGWFHPPREHTINSTPCISNLIIFFLTLIGLIIILCHTFLFFVQPIISEVKTPTHLTTGCAPSGSRFIQQRPNWIVGMYTSLRIHLYGALYFTKALKPSQFYEIDLTLRALTQPKTRVLSRRT